MEVTSTSPFQALAAIRPAGGADRSRTGADARSRSDRPDQADAARATSNEQRKANGQTLSKEEQQQVAKLRARDQEVRTHEQAHVAAAGALFRGGPFYSYQQGPDGKRYAVGGSVKIDTSPGRTPEETIQRAAQIRAAALAPAEPSGADRAIASNASRMEAQARQELAAEQAEGDEDASETTTTAEPSEAGDTAGTAQATDTATAEQAETAPKLGIEQPSEAEPKTNARRLDFAAAEASAFATSLGDAIDIFG